MANIDNSTVRSDFGILLLSTAHEHVLSHSSPKGHSMSNPQSIIQLFNTLLDAATKVGLAAAALFLAWAGFLYMTAGGSPRRMESAKDAASAFPPFRSPYRQE